MRGSHPLMIFAAGFGTRMGTLTQSRPKPMIEVAGQSLIDRAIDLGRDAGCGPIVANTHYLAHLLAPVLEQRGVVASHEATEILETGGGLKEALPLLGPGPVITLNPDVVWSGENPLRMLGKRGLDAATEALLLLVPAARARGRSGAGDFSLAADGRLIRGGDLVYTGAQLLRTERLAVIDKTVFSLNAVWDLMAADGALRGLVYDGEWCDVGHPAGLAEAEALLGTATHAG